MMNRRVLKKFVPAITLAAAVALGLGALQSASAAVGTPVDSVTQPAQQEPTSTPTPAPATPASPTSVPNAAPTATTQPDSTIPKGWEPTQSSCVECI
jgi:hypothetical protein